MNVEGSLETSGMCVFHAMEVRFGETHGEWHMKIRCMLLWGVDRELRLMPKLLEWGTHTTENQREMVQMNEDVVQCSTILKSDCRQLGKELST